MPFVPVTPTTASSADGWPKKRSAIGPIAARTDVDEQLRRVEVERALDDERRGARGERAAGAKS